MAFNFGNLTAALENGNAATIAPGTESGVSFAGKSLKLNNEEDAKPVIQEIEKCKHLHFLNLEGNTLGVEAAKGLAKALEKHPEFKRALWKDLFTGRLKSEIPKALNFLGEGLVAAGARLQELDMSDNAFGPIGVEGLATLLKSPACHGLSELRLNNNGLGITGGRLLAQALTECYERSKSEGKPLALKVFIAGRNRLENEGAKALAQVFKMIGSLEEIAMPQNGIYHEGISALSDAFTHNKSLRVLNLNDNTIGVKGAKALAKALPSLPLLKEINFGDCLLKTKGAVVLASALSGGHCELEKLQLDSNEITKKGGLELVKAMANKNRLKSLLLDANMFGSDGKDEIFKSLKNIGKEEVLGSLSDNESEDEDEEEEEEEEDDQESSEDEVSEVLITSLKNITVADFLKTPSDQHFLALGEKRSQLLIEEAKRGVENSSDCESYFPVLMKVGALCDNTKSEVRNSALACWEALFRELLDWSQKTGNISVVNNTLLIHLRLIKNEEKRRPNWNLEPCLRALLYALEKNSGIPETTRDTLRVFMRKEVDNKSEFAGIKQEILRSLK